MGKAVDMPGSLRFCGTLIAGLSPSRASRLPVLQSKGALALYTQFVQPASCCVTGGSHDCSLGKGWLDDFDPLP